MKIKKGAHVVPFFYCSFPYMLVNYREPALFLKCLNGNTIKPLVKVLNSRMCHSERSEDSPVYIDVTKNGTFTLFKVTLLR